MRNSDPKKVILADSHIEALEYNLRVKSRQRETALEKTKKPGSAIAPACCIDEAGENKAIKKSKPYTVEYQVVVLKLTRLAGSYLSIMLTMR